MDTALVLVEKTSKNHVLWCEIIFWTSYIDWPRIAATRKEKIFLWDLTEIYRKPLVVYDQEIIYFPYKNCRFIANKTKIVLESSVVENYEYI